MYRLFYTPSWFNGWDLIFEAVMLVIALLVAAYSWKIYRMSSENKFKYFSLAFLLISLGFVFKLITHGVLYYSSLQEVAYQALKPITTSVLSYSDILYRIGFFLQMVFMMGGWLLVFFVSQKSRERLKKFHEVTQIGLFIYLIVLVSFVSNFKYFVFYLTSAVILGMVVLNYYKNYLNTNKNGNALLVLSSFLLILLGQFFFIFVVWSQELYILGEIALLGGFLLLLYTYKKIKR